MKQKMFVGWVAALMLFGLYACSKEEGKELDENVTQTRSYQWAPLEWAYNYKIQGTGPCTPGTVYYPLIEPCLEGNERYLYKVVADWDTGVSNTTDPNSIFRPELYYLQIQWTTGDPGRPWEAVWWWANTPLGWGLVEILDSSHIESLSAYAFPHSSWIDGSLSIRVRTVRRDFVNSLPVPGADVEYMFDRSLFSPWGTDYCWMSDYDEPDHSGNLYGYNRPLTELGDDDEGDLERINTDANFIVKVILPDDPDFLYSCKSIYNHSGGYTEDIKSKVYNEFIVKGVGTRISYSGELEIEITCVDKNIPGRGGHFSFTVPYSFNDNILEIIADEYNN